MSDTKLIDFFDWLKEDDGRFFEDGTFGNHYYDDGGEEVIHKLCASGAAPCINLDDVKALRTPKHFNDTYIHETISTLYFDLPSDYDDVISFFISLSKFRPKSIEEALAHAVKVKF
jgi:hypothetical protein